MGFTWPIVLSMLVVVALQLAVGVVVWRFLLDRGGERRSSEPLHRVTQQVRQVLASVVGDVNDHDAAIRAASRILAAAGEDARSPAALDAVAGLLQVNEQLQSRLADAESRLHEQATQIETHFNAARTDPLTRLSNRRVFDEELLTELARIHRDHGVCGLLMLDADHFKRLNDQRGHLAGDQGLRGIAEMLRRVVGGRGLVARVGGEEFAVILPRASALATQEIAEQIRSRMASEEFNGEHGPLRLTVSVGATEMRIGDNAASIIGRADEALYAAKHGGRNASYFHDGRQCHRIAATEGDEPGWHDLCDELKQQLAQLVEHG
jgi:diguanylate cyclase